MCGRFTQTLSWSALVAHYGITVSSPPLNLPIRYNVAPTQDVAVVRAGAGGAGRELAMVRWGLIPHWAKDAAIGARMINARAETVAEKPSFRDAFERRRCLIHTDGFYEWCKQPHAGKQSGRPKQPYFIAMTDAAPFAFAGLWERWLPTPDSKPVETCTILTTEANETLRPVHHRMPVILDPANFGAWLDVDGNRGQDVAPLLQPYRSAAMIANPVSRYVNKVANDDARCLEPASAEDEGHTGTLL